nr:hypothetical protein QIA22_01250 [Borreliella kurtenbachii]
MGNKEVVNGFFEVFNRELEGGNISKKLKYCRETTKFVLIGLWTFSFKWINIKILF